MRAIVNKLFGRLTSLALLAAAACTAPAPAPQPTPQPALMTMGGATMYPNYTIVQNAANSKEHTTLVAALNAAGLAQTLSGPGPYTLFAPTDSAFRQLPNGTVEALMHPRSRPELSGLLNYHVVPGAKSRSQIEADIRAGGGTATYRTAQGGSIRVRTEGGDIVVTDANGRKGRVTQADVRQANGIIHSVATVLQPSG